MRVSDRTSARRFTVPVLWDKQKKTIVNNESSEIIRMFNTAFNDQLPADKAKLDLYPEPLRKEIDELNEWVYDTVNSARPSPSFLPPLLSTFYGTDKGR